MQGRCLLGLSISLKEADSLGLRSRLYDMCSGGTGAKEAPGFQGRLKCSRSPTQAESSGKASLHVRLCGREQGDEETD